MERSLRILCIPAVCLAIGLAGCVTPALQKSGLSIKDAAEPLRQGEDATKKLFKYQIDQQLVTQSPDSRCYYVRPDAKSKEVEDRISCGPYRWLGQPADQAWLSMDLTFKQSGKEVTAVVGSPLGGLESTDTALLVRPDGKTPAAEDSVPDPLAPESTAKNVSAMVAPEALAQVNFTDLPKPHRLITPAATIEVSAMADLDRIPGEVLTVLEPPKSEGVAPEYRVGAGQKLQAWRVKVGPTTGHGEPVEVPKASSDASSALGVTIGGRKLPVKRAPASSASPWPTPSSGAGVDTFTVACGSSESYYGSKTFPCKEFAPIDQVLLVMHDAQQQPSLTASVNGSEQALDLAGGEVKSSVSAVDYSRTNFTQSGGATLDPGAITAPKDSYRSDCTATAVRVQSVSLSGFDPYANWAQPGRAWLTVEFEKKPLGYSCSSYRIDAGNSAVLSLGGKDQGAKTIDKDGARYTFDVPEDFANGQFGWRPRGRASGYPNDWDFAAPNRATMDISIPK